MESFDSGGHNEMILPNSGSNGNKSADFDLENSLYLKTKEPVEQGFFIELESVTYHEKRKLLLGERKEQR
jgi:hypothetical protein